MNMKTSVVEHRTWSATDIRIACIENNLYTRGNNEEYDRMFEYALSNDPTPEVLYAVAKDIYAHSVEQSITNIMCILANEVVRYSYTIEGYDVWPIED